MKTAEQKAISMSHGTITKINGVIIGLKIKKYSNIKAGKMINDILIDYGRRCFNAGCNFQANLS